MGLFDMILKAVDADYRGLESFTSEPGQFQPGNRVRDEGPTWRGRQAKSRHYEVVRVERRYDRNAGAYDKGWARRVDSLGGCNCGRPGCPG